ncbi:MAG TPA: alpha-glucan family phosphorylase [Cytophagales bacterium]|nr:alpha-glucan family phosphorylase [Cytophagales bacterium]
MADYSKYNSHPYTYDPQYSKPVAYFSMEFGIHQPLKIYSGGLGFLAGSHMRSAYELKQNVIGIGILWRNGYYDQIRRGDKTMDVLFQQKLYSYLEDTGIKYEITVHGHPVWVQAFYLAPEVFGTAPMFLLTTDIPENDYISQTITHNLYDADAAAKVAQSMVLGIGGAKLLDVLGRETEVYHLNEAHALSAAFYLYSKFGNVEAVKQRMVFTTHTPEEAGNEKHDIGMLQNMSFFAGVPMDKVREISGIHDHVFNHTLVGLRLSRIANGVSKKHGEVSRQMWSGHEGVCPILHITNSQNAKYWADEELYAAQQAGDVAALKARKSALKRIAFEEVADQSGKLFDPEVLTVVWGRRFAGYKRPELITRDVQRFERIRHSTDRPIQLIWAGKPYPMDLGAKSTFNALVHNSKGWKNVSVLVGYELKLSKLLKGAADVWLNNPRIPREASGTSGMTASNNGAVNLSTADGWMLEYAKHQVNAWMPEPAAPGTPDHEVDRHDMDTLLDALENEILPMYYDRTDQWWQVVQNSMADVLPFFDSDRMAHEYYEKLYTAE